MKTVKIRKNNEFSPDSKVFLHIGEKQIHIKGFESFSFNVEPGQEFFASQLWTKSNKITYNQLDNSSCLIIKPRLGKVLAFTSLMIFAACTLVFIFTKFRWSYIPLVLIGFYVLFYLTILRDKYLIIKPYKEEIKSPVT
jgi:hypothetical protein